MSGMVDEGPNGDAFVGSNRENRFLIATFASAPPPSPPPRSIRPTVRRLLRSPRLSGPGPHQFWQLWLFRLWRQGRGHLGDRLKFCQKLWPMLHQVPDDPSVPEQLSQIPFDDGQLQVVLAVGVLN